MDGGGDSSSFFPLFYPIYSTSLSLLTGITAIGWVAAYYQHYKGPDRMMSDFVCAAF